MTRDPDSGPTPSPGPGSTSGSERRLVLTAGPLAAEHRLLSDLAARPQPGDPDYRALLIVVPSQALRDHLHARIVALRGAVIGVRITTLFGAALEAVDDAAGRALAGRDLFPLLVRRAAEADRVLRRELQHLQDGYSALLSGVRDLLDAGFEPALGEAAMEALDAEGGTLASKRELERARSLLAVAGAAHAALEATSTGRRSTVLQRATETLFAEAPLVARSSCWVYGFADASGVAIDFLRALLARCGGRIYLDRPPDPVLAAAAQDAAVTGAGADPDRTPDNPFTRHFRERFGDLTTTIDESRTDAPRLEIFRALGSDGELREVALRIRQLLDAGAQPETISVVARRLQPYERALRQQFRALALPYSGYATRAARTAGGRRRDALVDLLRRRSRVPVERWLDSLPATVGGRPISEVRTALAALGIARLEDVEALAQDEARLAHDLPLDTRLGFESADQSSGRLRRRRVPAATLRAAAELGRDLVERFTTWESATTVPEHLAHLEALLGSLDWREEDLPPPSTLHALEALDGGTVTLDEFVELLAVPLLDSGRVPLGGRGGGIQVLDVTEARGRTSEHLFLIGLNRGTFPRVVREDPLLPDPLRHLLGRLGHSVLPDLLPKRLGHDEERFLFDQLLASAPHVTLSWQDTDDDQAPVAPSPLLERLRWSRDDTDWERPPLARAPLARTDPMPRSADEVLVATAIRRDRSTLRDALGRLLPEDLDHREALARARVQVLDALDPDLSTEAGRAARRDLGPYLGLVGRATEDDPRRLQKLWITTLERLTGCPWQAFLERLLRLRPVPDPLSTLPGVTPRLLGSLVHQVAEEIVHRGLGEEVRSFELARARLPVPIPWPEERDLEKMVVAAARRLCRAEGLTVRGFPELLARAAAAHLEHARELEGREPPHVLGAELEGVLEVEDYAGRARRLHFRADRLDLHGRSFVATDLKTGRRPVSEAKTAAGRRKALLDGVRRGDRLQAPAYALAGGEPSDRGRYLFLHPEIAGGRSVREVSVDGDDDEIEVAFGAAVAAGLATWDFGAFYPRMVEPDGEREPFRCRVCEVRDACLRGDSGSRRRLKEWMGARDGARQVTTLSPLEAAFALSWRLGS